MCSNYNMPTYQNNIPYEINYRAYNNYNGNKRLIPGSFALPFALGFATGPLVLGGLGYGNPYPPRPSYYPYPPPPPRPYPPRPFF